MHQLDLMSGTDRITQILQSASGSYAQPTSLNPPMMPNVMPDPISQPIPIHIAVQQGVAAGHPGAVALDNKLKLWSNNDPEAYNSALEYMDKMPGEIDPTNSYQVNLALAQWHKQMPSPLQLGIQDLGQVAAGNASDYLGLQQKAVKNISDISAAESLAGYRAKGGSGGGTTMQVFKMLKEKYPEMDDMTALRIAQNKISQDTYVDPNTGVQSAIPGAPQALGELAAGTAGGRLSQELGYAGPIEAAKQEAQTEAAPLKEFGSKVGADIGSALVVKKTAAETANQTIVSNNEARKLLNKGVIAGTGAEYLLNFGRALSQSGISLADNPVENTQAFIAIRAQEVGRIIKLFGSGTGLSDADRDYAERAAAGKIEMNTGAMKKIMDISDRSARYAIANYNKELSRVPKKAVPYDISVEPLPTGSTKNWVIKNGKLIQQ